MANKRERKQRSRKGTWKAQMEGGGSQSDPKKLEKATNHLQMPLSAI